MKKHPFIHWRNTILAMLLILGFAGSLKPQNAALVTGKVTSAKTGQPIGQASVFLQPVQQGTTTSEAGIYQFKNLPHGAFTLIVSHVGFKSQQKTVSALAGQTLTVNFELETDIKSIPGIEITGYPFEHEPFPASVINTLEMTKIPARDVAEVMKSEPNVSGIRRGGNNLEPVVRGLKSGQVNVQLNYGQKVEGGCPNRMDPTASHVEVGDVSQIEILKGPYALRFGPNLGAIVRLVTNKARPFETPQMHATLAESWQSNLNGNIGHATIYGGNKRAFFALSGNKVEFGNYTSGNGTRISSSSKKLSFTAEAGFIPLKHHETRIAYSRSMGKDVMFPALPMDEREDNTDLMSVSWKYYHPGKTLQSINAQVYRSVVYHEMDNRQRPVSDTVVAISKVNAKNDGARMDAGFRIYKSLFHTGFDFEHVTKDGERTKYLIMQPGLPVKNEDLWQNADIRNIGLFAELRAPAGKFLTWLAAVRLDVNSADSDPMELKSMSGSVLYSNENVSSTFSNISVSAGLNMKINPKTFVDVSVGRGNRSPDMVERFIILLPVGYDNFDYLGNPQLKPETNHQADITLDYRCEHSGHTKINGFYSLISHYILGKLMPASEVRPQTAGVEGVKRFENYDLAHLYGVEISWSSPENLKWGGSVVAAYTAGYVTETEKYIYQNGEIVGFEKVANDPLPEIQPFESTVRFNYKFMDNRLIPEISVRIAAPQNRISASYGETDTPGFAIAAFNFNYQVNGFLNLSGGVNNIFDKNYYEHLNRRMIGTSAQLPEPGRVFFLRLAVEL